MQSQTHKLPLTTTYILSFTVPLSQAPELIFAHILSTTGSFCSGLSRWKNDTTLKKNPSTSEEGWVGVGKFTTCSNNRQTYNDSRPEIDTIPTHERKHASTHACTLSVHPLFFVHVLSIFHAHTTNHFVVAWRLRISRDMCRQYATASRECQWWLRLREVRLLCLGDSFPPPLSIGVKSFQL